MGATNILWMDRGWILTVHSKGMKDTHSPYFVPTYGISDSYFGSLLAQVFVGNDDTCSHFGDDSLHKMRSTHYPFETLMSVIVPCLKSL